MGKTRPNSNPSATWIHGPWLDLIVGCGAWSAPLLLISYATVASNARTWSVVFYVLALFFNYPHYMATIYRAYHRAEDIEKYRIFTVHITALLLLTLVLSHAWLHLLPWVFTIYLTWSPWHYSGQNYGLLMMFARRAGAEPDKSTRRALYGAFVVSYLILFLGFHTGPSADPLFHSLGIPAVVSRWEQIVLGVAFVVLSAFGLSRLARDTGWRKLLPSLTIFSSQCLWFLLPTAISLIRHIDIPQNRYSTGVLAIMHSAQYLWITSHFARREASDSGARRWRPLAYFGVLVIGGIALFVPGPWLASRALHHDFTASFLIFTALVNIHHFILDGAIWKLRDGRIAAFVLSSRGHVADAITETGGHVVSTLRWFKGDGPGARRLRVSAVLILLTWGTVDQVRFYLALHADDLHDLRRAASLNSFDSSLQMRLARKEMEEGNLQQAESAWKRAMQTDPADPAPRHALLKALLDQKRFEEAFDLTEASVQVMPRDANLLVDRGLLSLRRGRADQALANWELALAADPDQLLAHLYLAHELDRQGKALPAASHYKSYLEAVAQQHGQERPAPDLLVGIILRMADCQSRSSQTGLAVKSYRMAATLAAQTRQTKLESMAAVNEADLQARDGHLPEALRLYQHALSLDTSSGDSAAGAVDWYSYGRFLNDAGFSSRLAYACLLKSDAMANSLPKSPLPVSVAETLDNWSAAWARQLYPSSAVRKGLRKRRSRSVNRLHASHEPLTLLCTC